MAEQPRPPRFRWLVPTIAVNAMPGSLETLGAGSSDRGLAWAVLIGILAGAFWYWSYPRPLAERLAPLALAWSVAIVFVAVAAIERGNQGSVQDVGAPRLVAVGAILWALVMAEQVHRWRRDFRDELSVLETADR